jgi:xanthine dehydrogenase molybdopterin-binding subunit B
MDKVLDKIDYHNKRARCSFGDPAQDKWYGIGLAISYRGMSLGAEGVDLNSAVISVQPDGSILLETGIHENGQGSESAMILLTSEELGIRWNGSAIACPPRPTFRTAAPRWPHEVLSWAAELRSTRPVSSKELSLKQLRRI